MKTLTPKTHIGKVRQANLTQIEQVCQLLNWTREEFCNHQYNEYEEFIKRACVDLPEAANYLRHSPIFRGFYNHEWMLRTSAEFLPFALKMTETICEVNELGMLVWDEGFAFGHSAIVDEYQFIHEARRLFYDEVFAKMYGKIIDLILSRHV